MTAVAVSAIGFSAAINVSDAQAQATIPKVNGNCPGGYDKGGAVAGRPNASLCYERSRGSGAEYQARQERARNAPDAPPPPESATIRKPSRSDRCPAGYFSVQSDISRCETIVADKPVARLKGATSCRAGELSEWGIWCTSNTAKLTRGEVLNALITDVNNIMSEIASPPNTDTTTSPTFMTLFPAGGASQAATPAAAPARASSAPAARDTRVGSLNPQRRTATTWGICPSGWYPGQAGSDLPNPDMCYPAPTATPVFPVASQDAACPENYTNTVSWCVAASRNMPTAPSATQAAAQTPPNCPASSTGAAQQMGSALGGLLGGRRVNSAAGSALGGLLGQAAAGAAKPAGCP